MSAGLSAAGLCGEALSVRHGQEVTLSYPDFAWPAGAQVAVTGPSGSGKTTLLNLIAGLLRPQTGRVRYGDLDLAALPESGRDAYRRRTVGYVFQDFHLLPGLTAQENVEVALRLAGTRNPAQAARAALTRLDLGERLRHTPAQLSTGERQRVAIARAVAHRPQLLLVDEPTAHLDRQRAARAITLLREVATELGATVVVVTHDEAVAEQWPGRLHLAPSPASALPTGADA